MADDSIQVQSDRVVLHDGQNRATVFFDHIFKNQHDFAKSAYNATLAPLVQRVMRNEPALFVCGGLHSTQMQHYMMSQTVMQVWVCVCIWYMVYGVWYMPHILYPILLPQSPGPVVPSRLATSAPRACAGAPPLLRHLLLVQAQRAQ
ncbi:hypothetical protein EON65_51515 [archaeon]|nr:MAG: hypothetical protein EON65_51515 [archaeon]